MFLSCAFTGFLPALKVRDLMRRDIRSEMWISDDDCKQMLSGGYLMIIVNKCCQVDI